MKKILVAVDGSNVTPKAVKQAAELARLYQGSLTLIKVVDVPADANYDDYQVYVSEAYLTDRKRIVKSRIENEKKMLDAIAKTIDTKGFTFEQKILAGVPYEQILKEAKSGEYDLVVMGRRGLSPLKRFFMGSVTQTVIAEAPCAVLVVRE